MEYKNTLLVVSDIKASVDFYKRVLGLDVILDFGENVTLTGGICLQSSKSWTEFISAQSKDIIFDGRSFEIYFEEEDFDGFARYLAGLDGIKYIHPVIEHRWGQRVVRFCDPNGHIIEVGECMKTVCKRFIKSGMTAEQTAERMDVPLEYVKSCME